MEATVRRAPERAAGLSLPGCGKLGRAASMVGTPADAGEAVERAASGGTPAYLVQPGHYRQHGPAMPILLILKIARTMALALLHQAR